VTDAVSPSCAPCAHCQWHRAIPLAVQERWTSHHHGAGRTFTKERPAEPEEDARRTVRQRPARPVPTPTVASGCPSGGSGAVGHPIAMGLGEQLRQFCPRRCSGSSVCQPRCPSSRPGSSGPTRAHRQKEGNQAQHDLEPWTAQARQEAQEAPILGRVIQAGRHCACPSGALRWTHRGEPHEFMRPAAERQTHPHQRWNARRHFPPFHAPVHLGVNSEGFGYLCLGQSRARSCLLGCRANGGGELALADLDVSRQRRQLATSCRGAPGTCNGGRFRGSVGHA
jgi:hypothetical protein